MLAVWFVAVLGAISAALVAATRGSESLALNLKAGAQARRAAESGAVMAVSALEQRLAITRDDTVRRALLNSLEKSSSRADEIALGEERFAFTYVDVNSRLDINWASVPQLSRLFQFFTSSVEATSAAELIHNHGMPFRSLDALRSVPGLSLDLLTKAAPYLTVDGDGRIDAASASDTVLTAAAGDAEYEPSRILIISRGWASGNKLTHEVQAVYGIEMNKLVLVHWRERDL